MIRDRWTPKAAGDLEAIRDFIGRSSPRYGAMVAARLARAVDDLREYPDLGRVVPEHDRTDVRELIRGSYRIVYLRGAELIVVLTVFRASRRFPELDLPTRPEERPATDGHADADPE